MKPTTKIRFTEPQIALMMRAHPNYNLELSFAFDQTGKIIDCIGTKDSENIAPEGGAKPLVSALEAFPRGLGTLGCA